MTATRRRKVESTQKNAKKMNFLMAPAIYGSGAIKSRLERDKGGAWPVRNDAAAGREFGTFAGTL